MAVVIPPGFAEVGIEMRNSADPDPWYCTFGVDRSASVTGPIGDAQLIYGYWMDTFGGNLHTSTTISGVRMRVGQDGGDPLIVFFAGSETGDSTASMLPQNCALLVTKTTNLGGRKGKGRFYVPNILVEGSVSQTGFIDSSAFTAMQTISTQFFEALESFTLPMVLLHNEYTPQPEPTLVTSLVPSDLIATQRRRLR